MRPLRVLSLRFKFFNLSELEKGELIRKRPALADLQLIPTLTKRNNEGEDNQDSTHVSVSFLFSKIIQKIFFPNGQFLIQGTGVLIHSEGCL